MCDIMKRKCCVELTISILQITRKKYGRKLWIKIAEKEMSNPQVREMAEVSASTFTKLKKNEYVSLESLVKIAIALDCEVGDIVEIVKDEEKEEV